MSLPNKTPTRTRSLGLRKSGIRSTDPKTTKTRSDNVKTPNITQSKQIIKSKSAIKHKETTTPTGNKSPPPTQSAPPNFTPYRLSLNKRLRETMTKKRLEFHMAQEKEKAQTSLSQDVDALSMNDDGSGCTYSSPEQGTVANNISTPTSRNTSEFDDKSSKDPKNDHTQKRGKLIRQIEIVEEEMQARQRHISKTLELQGEIDRWRITFHSAIDDLQNSIEPHQTKLALVRGLGIDESLLEIEDDIN